MLDQLRRHASSWMVKAVLTLIILTFIFFFGYSRVASRYQDEHTYAAIVGDQGIPRRKFENMYQASLDRMRSSLKDQMPESIGDLLRKNVLDELISREVILLYAKDLGLGVSDDEIASAIRANKNFFPNGTFDLDFYEKTFLPQYRQRYGEEFEDTVRRDLLVEKTRTFMNTVFSPWQKELEDSIKDKHQLHASKDKTAETQATADPLTSSDLFNDWLDGYKRKIKIEVFER